MSTPDLYVLAAYACAAVGLTGLIGWVLTDQRNRRRELAQLEATGVKRRSEHGGNAS